MDQVTANMAELSGHVAALAGLARGISARPARRCCGSRAFVFGVRRAVGCAAAAPSAGRGARRGAAAAISGKRCCRAQPGRRRIAGRRRTLPRQRG